MQAGEDAGINPNQTKEIKGLYDQISESFGKTTEDGKVLSSTLKGISQNATDIVNNISLFDDQIIKASRSLGQSVVLAQELEMGFAEVAENIIKIGGKSSDVIDIFKNMSASLGRTVSFTKEALFNMSLLKQVGVSDENIQSFNTLFDKIGGTFGEAAIQQMKLVNQAKSYGMNVGSFMKDVSSQLSKINQYGFPNGVKDLGDMVAKSRQLGMSMETAMAFADKIMGSPEAALDAAAQLQTLGGSFSSLADPMELLYLAQNDLDGLNDKLINATRGLASFNEKTGQFEISVNERLRIKEAVKVFGGDANSIIDSATKLAKQEEILKRLDLSGALSGLDEEQQRVLAAFAQIGKDGKITLEGKELSEVMKKPDEIENILKKIQGAGSQFAIEGEDAEQKNIRMIQANASSIEKVIIAQNALESGFSLAAIQVGNFRDKLDAASNTFAGIVDSGSKFKNTIFKGASEKIADFKPLSDLETTLLAQKLGDAVGKISFPSLTLDKESTVKIDVVSSFDLEDVIKKGISSSFTNAFKAEFDRQWALRTKNDGSSNYTGSAPGNPTSGTKGNSGSGSGS